MAKKKPAASAVKSKARLVPRKRSVAAKRADKPAGRRKRVSEEAPPPKLFDAMKWCGVLPELTGDSVAIQRQMRDER